MSNPHLWINICKFLPDLGVVTQLQCCVPNCVLPSSEVSCLDLLQNQIIKIFVHMRFLVSQCHLEIVLNNVRHNPNFHVQIIVKPLIVFWHSPIGSRTIKRIFRLGRRSVKYKTLLTLTIIIIHRISTFMSVSKNARYKFHTRKYILSKLLDTFYLASQLFGIYTLPIQNLINIFLIPHSLTFGQDDLIRPK